MITISEAEARRESLVRSSGIPSMLNSARPYNTGAAMTVGNAEQYLATVVEIWSSTTGITGELTTTGVMSPVMLQFVRVNKPTRLSRIAPVSPAEMLERVRSAFSLRVSEAATVLHVSRPTIYQWATLHDVSQIRAEADRMRLQTLYRIASRWTDRGVIPGRWLTEVLSTGKSVFDLLSAPSINAKAIFYAHDALFSAKARLIREEHDRAVEAVGKLKTSFARMGERQRARNKEAS